MGGLLRRGRPKEAVIFNTTAWWDTGMPRGWDGSCQGRYEAGLLYFWCGWGFHDQLRVCIISLLANRTRSLPFPCIGNSDFTLSDPVWASSLVWFYKNSWVRVVRIQKKQTIPGKSESESFIYPFREVWFLIVVPKGFRVCCKSIYRHESLSQAPWGAWRNLSPVAAKKVPGGFGGDNVQISNLDLHYLLKYFDANLH